MHDDEYLLVPLVQRKDLCAHVITLLNQEWPRSEASRENSLSKSMNAEPPMSFVLIERLNGWVVGHARLCPLPNDESGCWIESVIVSANMRGRGFGRIIMCGVERAAKKYGFRKCYLSTEDKRIFYEKCGYECCDPVLNTGSNTLLLKNRRLRELFVAREENCKKKDVAASSERKPRPSNIAVCSKTAPHAPPPPPAPLSMAI
uniref:N-acetyltransferase domain-containing protein n=1 Tax=Parascaris univalens TaxID=6257 RepID=A0A915CJP1_PARUN